jgi:hypothetical protein
MEYENSLSRHLNSHAPASAHSLSTKARKAIGAHTTIPWRPCSINPGPPHCAQVDIDMGRLTCADYLAMSPDAEMAFSAWMSGWFNQKKGYTTVDLEAYARNIANVKQWCASNPQASVMGGLQAASGGAN